MRFGQAMVYVFLGSLILAIAVSIGASILGPPRLTTNLLLTIVWVLVGAALPVTICAISMDRGGRTWLGWSGVIAMAMAVPMWIWFIPMYDTLPTAARIILPVGATLLSSWSLLAGITSGILIMPVASRLHRWVRNGTIGSMLLTAVLGNLALAISLIQYHAGIGDLSSGHWDRVDTELLYRWFGVGVTFLGVGLFTTLLLLYEHKLRGETAHASERRAFSVNCPRCGMAQQLLTGGDACTGCGLKIKVTVV